MVGYRTNARNSHIAKSPVSYDFPVTKRTYAQVCVGVERNNAPWDPQLEGMVDKCNRYVNWASFYARTALHHDHFNILRVIQQCRRSLETAESEEKFQWVLDAKRDALLIAASDWFIHCAGWIYQEMSNSGEREREFLNYEGHIVESCYASSI